MKQELRVGKVTDSHEWLDNDEFNKRYNPPKNAWGVIEDRKNYQNFTYVYAISMGIFGPIKIGKSNNIWKRLKQLQTGSPDTLYVHGLMIETDTINEKRLHKIFEADGIKGEWFRPSTNLDKVLSMMLDIYCGDGDFKKLESFIDSLEDALNVS